jgi:hypothetical protein
MATSTPKDPAAKTGKKPTKNAVPIEGTSKLAKFLKDKKIDARRLLVVSHEIESFRPEDRAIRHNKRVSKKAEGEAKGEKETRKSRSGRPVTPRSLSAAMAGSPLSGPVKTRILRAVNHLLEQKKSEKVDLRAIFYSAIGPRVRPAIGSFRD